MSKRDIHAVMANNGGVNAYLNKNEHEDMTDDQLRQAVFDSRAPKNASGADFMTTSNRRNTLMRKYGYDFFDIDELQPHPDNNYSIDEGSIEVLADLIYLTKNTTPLLIRSLPEGLQIVDGERRWRAHKLLAKKYGEVWRMVPARCLDVDTTLSNEDILFMLNADNMGQREINPAEKAKGFAVIAERLVKQREEDPAFKEKYRGVKTKEILAQQFGISERSVTTELNIGRNLIKEGQELLGSGRISKGMADIVAKLSQDEQRAILELLAKENLSIQETSELIAEHKTTGQRISKDTLSGSQQTPKKKIQTTNDFLMKSVRALKRAQRCGEAANFRLIGEAKQILKELEDRSSY